MPAIAKAATKSLPHAASHMAAFATKASFSTESAAKSAPHSAKGSYAKLFSNCCCFLH